MKTLATAIVIAGLVLHTGAQTVDDILNRVSKQPQTQSSTQKNPGASSLGSDKIASGLKEALAIGATNAVALTGKPDGYLKNDAIRIPLPDRMKTVARGMRLMGMGAQVDEFEIGMNRAAEQAAPKAKAIFLNALKQMTFDGARQILSGGDTAATDFFRRTSSRELTDAFTPIVKDAMTKVGVVQQYNAVLKSAPGGGALAGKFDLDQYVVGKALDGLFYMVAQEEKKIRQNPAARTTTLLQQVFGRR